MSLFQDELEGRRIVDGLYGSDCDRTAEGREVNAQRAKLARTLMACDVKRWSAMVKIERYHIIVAGSPWNPFLTGSVARDVQSLSTGRIRSRITLG
jgi:hypothetical protein